MPPKNGGAKAVAKEKKAAGGKKKVQSKKSTSTLGETVEDFDQRSLTGAEGEDGASPVASPAASPKASPKASSPTQRRTKSTKRLLVQYDGPRPDEQLHELVREESKLGDQASVERVYEMLRNDEDVNQRTILGYTPLAIAAIAGNGPLVSLLLERGADATLRSIHRAELPLHHAARRGNRIVVQLLCEPTSAAGLIDAPNNTGWPPLHLAALAGHSNAIVALLRHGSNINSRNELSGGGTVLHAAVRLGGAEVAEELLDRDAEVDAVDALGRGALHFAAARGDHGCVSLLLRSRADANRMGEVGKTPLQLVPDYHPNREKISVLLQAYSRPAPEEFRADARFDRLDTRELDINAM